MIHSVEDKARKELVEIVKIQMEEYRSLLERAEAAERELENERMMSMKRFVETGRADKFAIEQKAVEFENTQIPSSAKHRCLGEFKFVLEGRDCCPQCWEKQNDDCDICHGEAGDGGLMDIEACVPWHLCKSIWLAMNKIKAEELRQQLNGGE